MNTGKFGFEQEAKPVQASGNAGDDAEFSDSRKGKKKYRDVADAAQAAFESAAYAAAAARAAVELSRSDSHDPDDHSSPHSQWKRVYQYDRHESNSKDKETHHGSQVEESSQSKRTPEKKVSSPYLSEGSAEGNLDLRTMSLDEVDPMKLLEKEVVIPDSDDDNYDPHGSSFDMNSRKLKDEVLDTEKTGPAFQYSSNKQIPSSLHAGLKVETGPENPTEHATKSPINKGPFSVRSRQVRGYWGASMSVLIFVLF